MIFKRVFEDVVIDIVFDIPYIRYYGEPKLTKPKELKGIKEIFSVDYIRNKCKCKVYVIGNDLWIQHRDFFSREIYDTNHEFRKKFIYNDTFGSIVLRNEAYIHITDFCKYVDERWILVDKVMRLFENKMEMGEYDLEDTDNSRMIEEIVHRLYKMKKEGLWNTL